MMTVDQIRALKTGDLVRALIPVSGGISCLDGDELELELPAGAVATVEDVRYLGARQGWALTMTFDNGITNTFDEGDNNGAFELEPVEHTFATWGERMAFLLQHKPADYPEADLLDDLKRLWEQPFPAAKPEADLRTEYRALVRGVCTGVLVVLAVDEDEAETLAQRWLAGNPLARKRDAQHIVGLQEVETEFCDFECME